MKIKLLFISSLLMLVFNTNAFAKDVDVRIAIFQNAEQVRLTIKGPYRIIDLGSNFELLNSGKNLNYVLTKAQDFGISLGSQKLKVNAVKLLPSSTKEIFVNGVPFKGSITLIKIADKKLLVINNLGIEDYIKGVLYHEVSHLWPLESLKAQAVAARTFALQKILSRHNRDYDLTADIYSQVYGGLYSEKARTNLAVDKTKGIFLSFKGKPFDAYYHSVCGGQTEDAAELWNVQIAPLAGVKCGFCKIAPHYQWQAQLKLKDVVDKLNFRGFKINGVEKIVPLSYTRSGRVKDLRVILAAGKYLTISAKDFRQALGPNLIKSTNFLVEINGSVVSVKGKGWGHGVGLCQWGAFFMAARGENFVEILQFYYPQSELMKIE